MTLPIRREAATTFRGRTEMAATGGIDVIDYCGQAVTPWVDGACGCCGRQWGSETRADGTPPECSGRHVAGSVWTDLLDAEAVGTKPIEEN